MRDKLAIATIIVLAVSFLLVAVTIPFGEPKTSDLDDYYITNGQEQVGANNIVTSIVFDFRGFDTLGEASVLFTAVTGVAILFRRRKTEDYYENE